MFIRKNVSAGFHVLQAMPIVTPHRLNANPFKKLEIYETIVWKIPKVATIYELNEIYDPWKAYKNLFIFR